VKLYVHLLVDKLKRSNMFRITEDPSSGSLVQCLAKNYKNDSIVSVDMDVYLRCVVHCIGSAFIYSELHTTHTTGQNKLP